MDYKKTATSVILGLLSFLLLLSADHQAALAHSTEGRIKVPLDWAKPTYDHFAYFIEPHVNREFYKGRHQPYMGRFYVVDFHRVEHSKNTAKVHFVVLDVRSNARFDDHMSFTRAEQGGWQYLDAEDQTHDVFTFIPEWQHFLQQHVQPTAMVGLPLLLLVLLLLRFRKRKVKAKNN